MNFTVRIFLGEESEKFDSYTGILNFLNGTRRGGDMPMCARLTSGYMPHEYSYLALSISSCPLAQPFLGETVPNCRYVLAAVPVMPWKAAPPPPPLDLSMLLSQLSSRGIPSEIILLDLGIQGCLSVSLIVVVSQFYFSASKV